MSFFLVSAPAKTRSARGEPPEYGPRVYPGESILCNKLVDEESGNSSYAVDMANCHLAVVAGNILQQSKNTENWTLVHFHTKVKRPDSALYVVNNTVVSDRRDGIFLNNRSPIEAKLINNVLVGNIKLVSGPRSSQGNVRADVVNFIDPLNYNFRLKPGAPAIDAGVDLGKVGHSEIHLHWEYVHPAGKRERPIVGILDAGAFEFEMASLGSTQGTHGFVRH